MKILVTSTKDNNIRHWVSVDEFLDLDEFEDHCKELFSDENNEEDPELQYIDSIGIPTQYVDTEKIDPDLWDIFLTDYDDYERDIVLAYSEELDDLDNAIDNYIGKYDSDADFARIYMEDMIGMGSLPDIIRPHIDWDSLSKDLMMDCIEVNGYYFRY